MHRKGIVLVAVVALVLTSGCTGLVFGDGLEEEAQPARVDQATVDDTGFEFQDAQVLDLNETVSVAGQERQIRATNHLARYGRQSSLPTADRETGAFIVVSTPEFSVLGRPMNPVADMSNRELLAEFRPQLEKQLGNDLENVRTVDERDEPVLGLEATVTTFAADTTVDGEEVTLNVHITKVLHEGDVVIALGAHPEALQQQAPEIHQLMRGIEHPAET